MIFKNRFRYIEIINNLEGAIKVKESWIIKKKYITGIHIYLSNNEDFSQSNILIYCGNHSHNFEKENFNDWDKFLKWAKGF